MGWGGWVGWNGYKQIGKQKKDNNRKGEGEREGEQRERTERENREREQRRRTEKAGYKGTTKVQKGMSEETSTTPPHPLTPSLTLIPHIVLQPPSEGDLHRLHPATDELCQYQAVAVHLCAGVVVAGREVLGTHII